MSSPYSPNDPSGPGNPYLSSYAEPFAEQRGRYPLASLGKRFAGGMFDAFAPGVALLPGLVLMLVGSDFIQAIAEERDPQQFGPLAFVGVGWIFFVTLAFTITNIVLLATRSQSLGKYLLKMQIHSMETDEPAGFVKSFLLRALLNGFIAGIVGCIPFMGLVYQLIDYCLIFRDDRRCLHDLIAGTKVVDIA